MRDTEDRNESTPLPGIGVAAIGGEQVDRKPGCQTATTRI
jgi:hypothetical protein